MTILTKIKMRLPWLGVACLLSFCVNTALASSSINSTANLLYTLSITVQGSGSLGGLKITDSLVLAPSESKPVSGVGTYTVTPNDLGAYNKQMTLLSDVQDGYANLSETGLFDFGFYNPTVDTNYQIDVSLAYELSANTSANVDAGDFADTDIFLSYFNTDFSFSGFDSASSFANSGVQLGSVQQNGSSGIFSFTLAPGESESLLAEVKLTGNVVASPVPVPAAIWLFGSGLLGLVGAKKRHL